MISFKDDYFPKDVIFYAFFSMFVMDKSGANYAGLENINLLLMLAGIISFVKILQIKYLNNFVGQTLRQNRYRLPVDYESQQINAA
jgi:putative transposase